MFWVPPVLRAGVGRRSQLGDERTHARVTGVREVALAVAAGDPGRGRGEAEEVFPGAQQREVVVRAAAHVRVHARSEQHRADLAAAGRERALAAAAVGRSMPSSKVMRISPSCLYAGDAWIIGTTLARNALALDEPAGARVRAVGARALARWSWPSSQRFGVMNV